MTAILVASIAQAGLAQSSSPPPTPKPVQWHFEWKEPYCTVSTGSEDDVALSIWTIPGTDSFQVYLLGSRARIPGVKSYSKAAVTLSAGGTPIESHVVDYSTGAKRVLRLSFAQQDGIGPKLGQAASLTADFGGKTLSVPIPGVRSAMKALQQCVDDSLPEWGVDPVAYAAVRVKPKYAGEEAWITHRDYPEDAVHALRNGMIVARLTIDPTGRVTDCAVVRSNGTPSMDKVTCAKALERARFTPAIGAGGQAVATSFIRTAVFELLDKPPR